MDADRDEAAADLQLPIEAARVYPHAAIAREAQHRVVEVARGAHIARRRVEMTEGGGQYQPERRYRSGIHGCTPHTVP